MRFSINGVDETGKTSNILYLKESNPDIEIVPNLTEFSEKWNITNEQGTTPGDYAWWFEDKGDEYNFIDVFVDSLKNREEYINNIDSSKVIIEDRGNILVFCSVLAFLHVKKGGISSDLRNYVEEMFNEYNLLNVKSHNLLLLNGESVEERVQNTMSRVDNEKEDFRFIYSEYQRMFNLNIESMSEQFVNLQISGLSLVDVNNAMREKMNLHIGKEVFDLLLQNNILLGLSGLSECGKSYSGKYLSKFHNVWNLKHGYFIKSISRRLGYDANTLSAAELVPKVIVEYSRFSNMHYYQNMLSLESFKTFPVVEELKKALGDKFQIVYIELDRALAVSREVEKTNSSIDVITKEVEDKDLFKKSKGCESIKGIADHIVDNNGNYGQLHRQIDDIVSGIKESECYVFNKDNEFDSPL